MRRFLAGTLLLVYLFSTTESHEILKLPRLIEHFAEHQKKDDQISLWKFLCMHYKHSNAIDADHDKDMKLPFKTQTDGNSSFFVSLLPEVKSSLPIPMRFEVSKKLNKDYRSFKITAYLEAIWQPPQFS